MKCFECKDGVYVKHKINYNTFSDTGINFVVEDVELLHCPNCGDECLDDGANNYIDKAIEKYVHSSQSGRRE